MPPQFNPFNGVQVSLFDATFWTQETAKAIRTRIDTTLYSQGVISGLTVAESSTNPGTVYVTSGIGYDPNGEKINIPFIQDQVSYNGAKLSNVSASYYVIARYIQGNDGTMGLDVNGACNFRHLTDSFQTAILKIGTDSTGVNDIILTKATSTGAGIALSFDTTQRQTFYARYAALGTATASIIVGGSITSLLGGSFQNVFAGPGGSSTVGGACFFSQVLGISDIKTQGDFINTTAGKGHIFTSVDGTKRARIFLQNDGTLRVDSLNYTL